MLRRLRGWPLLLFLLGTALLGTATATGLIAALLWVLPDAPDTSGMSANATAAVMALLAAPLVVGGLACVGVGILLLARRAQLRVPASHLTRAEDADLLGSDAESEGAAPGQDAADRP